MSKRNAVVSEGTAVASEGTSLATRGATTLTLIPGGTRAAEHGTHTQDQDAAAATTADKESTR